MLLLNMVRSLHSVMEFTYAGPLPNSLEDFWRMAWEQKLPTIVMLTKCFEERVNSQIVVIHRAFHKHVCAIFSLEKVRVLLA